jgi:hypothetical protein
MPKIRKINYYNHEKEMSVESHIEYSTPDRWSDKTRGNFFIRIPAGFLDFIEDQKAKQFVHSWTQRGQSIVATTGKNESEAETKFRNYMDLYFKEQIKEEKVLLYKYSCERPDKENHRWSDRESKIEFEFRSCIKKTIGTASKYYVRSNGRDDDEIDRHRRKEWIEIPYTPEGEYFLQSVEKGMVDLMDKFDKFIGGKDKILKTIESKQKLLA